MTGTTVMEKSPSARKPTPCYFFDRLPRELRDSIYTEAYGSWEHLLIHSTGLSTRTRSATGWELEGWTGDAGGCCYKLHDLAVSKQWYAEAMTPLLDRPITIHAIMVGVLSKIAIASSTFRNNLKAIVLIDVGDCKGTDVELFGLFPLLSTVSLMFRHNDVSIGIDGRLGYELESVIKSLKELRGLKEFAMVFEPGARIRPAERATIDRISRDIERIVTQPSMAG